MDAHSRASSQLLKPRPLELARMVPVPLLFVVSGVTVSFPAPPSMLSAFWFPSSP